MQNKSVLLKMLPVVIGAALMFNACRKEPHPPKPAPKIDWLLSQLGLSYEIEQEPGVPGSFAAQVHYFFYNASKKPWVHQVINRDFLYLLYEQRLDTFFYDRHQRLTEIRSIQFPYLQLAVDTVIQKKVFRYDVFNRKSRSLKYEFDKSTQQYSLTDSAVYLYQDTAISRTTYHLTAASAKQPAAAVVTLETELFLYNRKGNLVKKITTDIWGSTFEEEFRSYDDVQNPYLSLNLEGLELEPMEFPEGTGIYVDFWLAMDMPKFSRNNYQAIGISGPDIIIDYEAADSLVSNILRRVFADRVRNDNQHFRYIPFN